MQIYDKPVWQLMHEMVADLGLKKGDVFSKDQVLTWFERHYPKIKRSTISDHLVRQSTNDRNRIHFHGKPGHERDDLFFKIDARHFRLYDAESDPPPIRKTKQEQRAAEKQPRVDEASFLGEVTDTILKERLSRLRSAPLDTLIREAGVILEDRLRIVGEVDSTLHGVNLVDTVLSAERGTLVFSSNPGEQEGVKMLYRGAMQFIRNPPMHKLIEYPESTARLFIRLIDSLLQLLSELGPQIRGTTT
jgi:hypothetical protein